MRGDIPLSYLELLFTFPFPAGSIMSSAELQAQADTQGEKIRNMKEAIKADASSFSKEDLAKEVSHWFTRSRMFRTSNLSAKTWISFERSTDVRYGGAGRGT